MTILCAEITNLFRNGDGSVSGGSYVPIEIDLSRKCTAKTIRRAADESIAARVEPYLPEGESINPKYDIENMDSLMFQLGRERETCRSAKRRA